VGGVPVLPTFLVIGAMKSGTTSLWRYLSAHPDVFMCTPKEPNFFIAEGNWHLGVDWYASLFVRGVGRRAVGEASVAYTLFPHHRWVPKRIRQVLPEARLVYLMRHPLERMISHYRHMVTKGTERRPIDEALLQTPVYLDASRYALQIEQYLHHFDRSQMLLLTTDELEARREEALRRVYAFIGVDPGFLPEIADRAYHRADELRRPTRITFFMRRRKRTRLYWRLRRMVPESVWAAAYRATSRRPPPSGVRPSEEARRQLVEMLRPDLERLREHLQGDFDCWGLLGEPGGPRTGGP
jgi:hypothetical protein